MTQKTHQIEVTEKELALLNVLVDDAISSSNRIRQERAIELSEKLPTASRIKMSGL